MALPTLSGLFIFCAFGSGMPNSSTVLRVGFLLAMIALAFVVRVQTRRLRHRWLREPIRRSPLPAFGAWLAIFGLIIPLPAWNLWQAVRYGKILNMPKYGANHWEYISTNPGFFWYTVATSILMLSVPFVLLAYVLHARRRTRQNRTEGAGPWAQDGHVAPPAKPERFWFGTINSRPHAEKIVRRTAWAFIALSALLALAMARHFTAQNLFLALTFGAPAAALLWSKDVVLAAVLLGLCALLDLGSLLVEINGATGRHPAEAASHVVFGVMLVLTYVAWRGLIGTRYLKSKRAPGVAA